MSKSKIFRKKVIPYSTYSFKTKRIGGFKRHNKNRKTKQRVNIEVRLFFTRFIREMKKSFKEINNGFEYSHLDFAKHFSENTALKEKLEEDTLKLYEVIGDLNEKQKAETE